MPAKFENFLNNAVDTGAILVSFGAMLKSSKMSRKKKDILKRVFKSLDVKVIWKWEDDLTDDELKKNEKMLIAKWVPQQEILSHPNVKLFITHGGQSGFQEALCHQKPMVRKKRVSKCKIKLDSNSGGSVSFW